jgi:hypothetical protein
MAFTHMAFNPTTGLNDTSTYDDVPTNPRSVLQGISDQLRDYINDTLLDELESVTTGSSGAENIGSAAISGVESSPGVSAVTVRDQIIAVKAIADTAAAANLTAGSINNSNLFAADVVTQTAIANDAVGADQLAEDSVYTNAIQDNAVTQDKIADDAVGADQLAANAVVEASIVNGSVTEGKIGAGAVTPTKLGSTVLPSMYTATTATGDSTSGAFWRALAAGPYWNQNGSLSNAPTLYGFAILYKNVNDFFVIYHEQGTGAMFFTSGNMETTTCTWLRLGITLFGTSATPPAGTYPAGTIYVQHEA